MTKQKFTDGHIKPIPMLYPVPQRLYPADKTVDNIPRMHYFRCKYKNTIYNTECNLIFDSNLMQFQALVLRIKSY